MQIIKSIQEFRKLRLKLKNNIGFVPTMGNLHAGHASLIKESTLNNNITIVSIFINPTQFDNLNDFASYPKTIDDDINLLKNLKVDYLFLPTSTDLYHSGFDMHITDESITSQIMEGMYRPGHFNGMLTIVLKLLILIKPTKAYFGEKDYQQLTLVKSLVENYFLDVEIISCPTIRDEDKLALSSRNSKLNEDDFKLASKFPQILASNLSNAEVLIELTNLGFKVEYIETHESRRYGAVYLGEVRLIDNIIIRQNK